MADESSPDDLVEEAVTYITEHKYPDNCSNTRKRQIRKKAEKFVIKDNELFYLAGKDKSMVKYIKNKSDQLRILKSCHLDPTSGHLGVKKTVLRIKERFTWKGVWNDVKNLVNTCDLHGTMSELISSIAIIGLLYHLTKRIAMLQFTIVCQLEKFLLIRTKKQIASICFCTEDEIKVSTADVQTQRGGNDCGLFALEFITSLCENHNPCELNYIQHKLRPHLIKCFESKKISQFPIRQRKRHFNSPLQYKFPFYCNCRQPDTTNRMVECCTCETWFHEECINAPAEVWTDINFTWHCNECVPDWI